MFHFHFFFFYYHHCHFYLRISVSTAQGYPYFLGHQGSRMNHYLHGGRIHYLHFRKPIKPLNWTQSSSSLSSGTLKLEWKDCHTQFIIDSHTIYQNDTITSCWISTIFGSLHQITLHFRNRSLVMDECQIIVNHTQYSKVRDWTYIPITFHLISSAFYK